MKIKQKAMCFHHVLSISGECLPNEWARMAVSLRNYVIQNGLYATGPVFYKNGNVADIDKPENAPRNYTIYLPINMPVELAEDAPVAYIPKLYCENGLSFRHCDMDEPLKKTYALLLACADKNALALEDEFYHVFLDVYGEGMLDVYAPIKKADANG